MRVAVISDIHANLHALEAVREAIEQEAPDEIWCLGDLVGYGPQPDECCAWSAGHTAVCLAGNHDLGVLGTLDIDDFSDDAAAAAIWTRGVLGEPRPDLSVGAGRRAASARTSASSTRARATRSGSTCSPGRRREAAIHDSGFAITLVGHSHVPLAIPDDPGLPGGHAPGGTEIELDGARWLLNPGSVGQPRDGDPAAAWLLLDLDERRASFRRAEYDVERTQAEIRDQGLPDALAERLAHGV